MAENRERADNGVKKVFIVDDHPVLRKGIALLIDNEPNLAMCGEADSLPAAMENLERAAPDIVLVDLSLKDSDGLDLIARIRGVDGDLPVLVISAFDESRYAEKALKSGAQGYLMKGENIDTVIGAIHRVLAGGIYLSEEMMPKIIGKLASSDEEAPSPTEVLTGRELEVFQMIGGGRRVREIAATLGISPKTVHVYRDKIRKKLDISDAFALHHTAFLHFQREKQDSLYPDSKVTGS
ncbi:MAG: response regulator [Planctomycetota bacterium]|jgi:DNA-binding NarL/FixJ family response regulator